MAGELQDYTVDQAAGAIALTLGALGSLLLVIWQSRCLCRCRIGKVSPPVTLFTFCLRLVTLSNVTVRKCHKAIEDVAKGRKSMATIRSKCDAGVSHEQLALSQCSYVCVICNKPGARRG